MRGSPSITAEVVCWMRAMERRRAIPARVLDDPLAEHFLGPILSAALVGAKLSGDIGLAAERYFPGLSAYIVARHRFIDDALLAAGPVDQLLLLGAGYDTRAYRFAAQLGGARVFEVDHPATSSRKAQLVRTLGDTLPPVDVTRVEVDFETQALDERLLASGFARGRKTFVVWEGVSMYLTRRAIEGTLDLLHALTGPGSRVAMDYWFLLDSPDLRATAHRLEPQLLSFLGEPVTFGIHPEDVGGFLGRRGYRVVELADAAQLEARYIRDGRKIYPANYVVVAEHTHA